MNPQNLCKSLAFNVPISCGDMGDRDRESLKTGRPASLCIQWKNHREPFV